MRQVQILEEKNALYHMEGSMHATSTPLLHKNEKSKKLIFSHGILEELRCGRPEGGKPDAAHQNQQVLRSNSSSGKKPSKKHVRDVKKIEISNTEPEGTP